MGETGNIKGKKTSYLGQVIFILLLIYSVSSIAVLALTYGILPHYPGVNLKPYSVIGYALISFAGAILVGLYHITTMIRSNKRKTDG